MADLVIKISGDSKEFQAEVDRIKKSSADLEDQLGSIAKVSGVAFAGLVAAGGLAVKSFAEANKASKDLEIALQNQGLAGKGLADSYKQIAKDLSDLTGVDDDAIIAGEAVLQNFLGQTEITPQLAAAMVDLGEKTGSVSSAAEILGRAAQGNTRGLKQFGIVIDENLTKEERLAAITEQVSQKFGGLAKQTGENAGSTRKLETAFGNFIENVGKRLAPLFDTVVASLTKFFDTLNNNEGLLTFIVEVGKIAALIAGLVAGAATAALAVVKFQQALQVASAAMKILGVSTRALVGATGIGLLLIVIAEIALNWNTIWPALVAVYSAFVNNISKLASAVGKILQGVYERDVSKIRAGYSEATAVIAKGFDEVAAMGEKSVATNDKQNAAKLAAAKKRQAEEVAAEQRKQDVISAQNELAVLEAQQASEATIALKKQEVEILKQIEDDKNKGIREQLEERLNTINALQEQQARTELEQKKIYDDLKLEQDAAFLALSAEQQALFLEQNKQKELDALLTKDQAQAKYAQAEIQRRIATNNKYLEEQARYGTAVATINAAINSQQVQGVQQTTNQLTALQNSRNSTLKAAGKAAAVADITIRTAQGAMAAFQGFLQAIPFPPVAIPLGIAAAAGVIAYGGEQIGNVLGAQAGGLVPGANTGGDSVPSMLQAGELVVPRANFSEVVNAVASARAQDAPEATSGVSGIGSPTSSNVAVKLEFSGDNAEKFLTARQVEARTLGTLRESTA